MGQVVFPEYIIYSSLKSIFKYLQIDFSSKENEEDTLLYQLLNNSQIEKYNLYEQGKSLFLAEVDNPRQISIGLSYNKEIKDPPSIFIQLPSENSPDQNIGEGEGQEVYYSNDGSSFNSIFKRWYSATYQIVVTSDNTNEVVLIYHLLKSLLVSLIPHFDLSGLKKMTIGGGDLNIRSEIVPPNFFFRVINLGCTYQSGSLDLNSHTILNDLIAKGNLVEE